MRLRIRERVAGIPREAVGDITQVVPGTEVSWQADRARYRRLGGTFTVREAVTWRVEPDGEDHARLSARVWAKFPQPAIGPLLEWIFAHLLHGIAKDREHTRVELRYLKRSIEDGSG